VPRSLPSRPGYLRRGVDRVPGLRRSEVADLAGMSAEYYAKLERGALGGVSASVLDAIAALSSLTKPNAPTCSTSRKPSTAPARPCGPAAAATSGPCGRACNGPSTPSPPRRRSSATTGLTRWPPPPGPGAIRRPLQRPQRRTDFARFAFLELALLVSRAATQQPTQVQARS
jgi:hypothetical protein